MVVPVVLVHGGAGNIGDETVSDVISGVKKAAEKGYDVLMKTDSPLDAVQAAVEQMEDDPHFNAGFYTLLLLLLLMCF